MLLKVGCAVWALPGRGVVAPATIRLLLPLLLSPGLGGSSLCGRPGAAAGARLLAAALPRRGAVAASQQVHHFRLPLHLNVRLGLLQPGSKRRVELCWRAFQQLAAPLLLALLLLLAGTGGPTPSTGAVRCLLKIVVAAAAQGRRSPGYAALLLLLPWLHARRLERQALRPRPGRQRFGSRAAVGGGWQAA